MHKKIPVRTFLLFTVPPLAILLATIIAVTAVMYLYADTMDILYGSGERIVVSAEDTRGWDTEYYDRLFSDDDLSRANGAMVTEEVAAEGIVLMKNNGILPLADNSPVTPFGYRYVCPVYGGTGSGNSFVSDEYGWSAEDCLKKYYAVNEEAEIRLKSSVPVQLTKYSAENAFSEEDGDNEFAEASTSLYEFEPTVYEGLEDSFRGTVGVVFIGRIGGEGQNIPHDPFFMNRAAHGLALSDYEKQMLAVAKEYCDGVVVILNTSNAMEIGCLLSGEYEADAIVWVGGPGSTGFSALADILSGRVNPSGRTVDIWERDILSGPVMHNYDEQLYTNTEDICIAGEGNRRFPPGVYFLEYEEGIYYGYRYYETADVEDENFVYGTLDGLGGAEEEGAVTYPFGYGLSYTSFRQTIRSCTDDGQTVAVEVEVENVGDMDGKEVVQLYYTPPYTHFDELNGIEKAEKNLVAFGKVFAEAGKKARLTLSFPKEDMASYFYGRDNGDGTCGCYFLESGTYTITLGKNSHDSWDTAEVQVTDDIFYCGDNARQSEKTAQSALDKSGKPLGVPAAAAEDASAKFVAATNMFADSSEYMLSEARILTRADWNGTFPRLSEPKALSRERRDECAAFDPVNDPEMGMGVPGSTTYADSQPPSGKDNGLKLSDMRGIDYYDRAWDLFLDQIDYDEGAVLDTVFSSRFSTEQIDSIGKPSTTDLDGPHGVKITGASEILKSCAYCTEVVLGSTWNVGLAEKFGKAVGQECLTLGVNGWYAPALNVHRSPFGGRNFEYYSEDPLILGKMASACVEGAAEEGVVCYIKHFGMNEFEDKAINTCCWATEQTIREIYLRPFEIAVKQTMMTLDYIMDENGTRTTKVMRGCTAVMAAGTLMGATWAAADRDLICGILRGEWGFCGVVTTDIAPQATPYASYKCIFAGSDLRMSHNSGDTSLMNCAAGRNVVRRALKNICYAYANSNVTNGLAPGATVYWGISPWEYGLLIANIVCYSVILCGVAVVVWYCIAYKRSCL